jgi:hypothetical protein
MVSLSGRAACKLRSPVQLLLSRYTATQLAEGQRSRVLGVRVVPG